MSKRKYNVVRAVDENGKTFFKQVGTVIVSSRPDEDTGVLFLNMFPGNYVLFEVCEHGQGMRMACDKCGRSWQKKKGDSS